MQDYGHTRAYRGSSRFPQVIHDYLTGAQYLVSSEADISEASSDVAVSRIPLRLVPRHADSTRLTVTVELTRACNFACRYCSQASWSSVGELAPELEQQIATYIANATSRKSYENVVLNFIGGEPMMRAAQLQRIAKKVQTAVDCQTLIDFDTNGGYSLRTLWEAFSGLRIVVTLSSPEDHNLLRPLRGGQPSISRVLKHLKELKVLQGRVLDIRFNAHHENVASFPSFVDWLQSQELDVIGSVLVANIGNYPGASFRNELSDTEYDLWRQEVAIPLLDSVGWGSNSSVLPLRQTCAGHERYSCKVLVDGSMVICNAMGDEFSRIRLQDCYDDPGAFTRAYSDIKTFDDPPIARCGSCPVQDYCSGPQWCGSNECPSTNPQQVFYNELDAHLRFKFGPIIQEDPRNVHAAPVQRQCNS